MSDQLESAICPHCKTHFGIAPWEYRDLWELLVKSELNGGRVTLDAKVVRGLLIHIERLRIKEIPKPSVYFGNGFIIEENTSREILPQHVCGYNGCTSGEHCAVTAKEDV